MRFFSSRRQDAAPVHRLPDGLRVYAVGDVHGRDDLLAAMEGRIAADLAWQPPAADPLLVFLGDYIDRGPASAAVIERLTRGAFAGLATRFLLGNHEEGLLRFLADPVAAASWLGWGGRETLDSYGVDPGAADTPAALRRVAAELGEAMPAAHHAFLRDLELTVEAGDFLFVHAGIRPGIALDRQRREDLLWIRQPFLSAARPGPLRVVHGHTISDEVELLPHRVGVDTGAYASGRLSCVAIEGEAVRVLA